MAETKCLAGNGFEILHAIYSAEEVEKISAQIDKANTDGASFRKSAELFAIRQFLQSIPETQELIFNPHLKSMLQSLFGSRCFAVKSIYFDKPPASNWYVSYHQDLTISVDRKMPLAGFQFWTSKQHQFAVQPPLNFLQNIVTVRIHLDAANEENGALKVVPKSHLKGVYRPETIDWTIEKEVNCPVPKGGVMLMKPLLLHSSGRTTNQQRRRVIHIEFSNQELPAGLCWAERLAVPALS